MAASSSSLRKMGEEKGKNSNGGDSDLSEPVGRRRMKALQVTVREKWEVQARIVSRKLSMVMSSVFGSRKSAEKICSRPGDGEKNSERRGGGEKGKSSLKQRMTLMPNRRGGKGSVSFGSLFSKKTGLKLLRRKIMGGGSHERRRIVKIKMLKDAGTVNLAKILKRRRTAPNLGGKEEKEEEEEEEEEETVETDAELCKKRILMGEKCSPMLPESESFH